MCIGRTVQFLLKEEDEQLRLGVVVDINDKEYLIQVPNELDVISDKKILKRRWVKKKLVFFTDYERGNKK